MTDFIDWIFGVIGALLGAVAFDMHKRIEKVREDLGVHKELIAREYASKADFERMNVKLDRIIDKLGDKQDRTH